MLKRLLSCLLLLVAASLSMGFAQTQTPTTQGTEFWLSFMRNGYRNGSHDHLTLIASAKEGCEVTVSNPNTGYSSTFSVPDQGVHTIEIPDAEGYNEQQSGKANKGLLVTSTDTISLYIANEAENSYDAANVLPVNALGYQYMVQSNKSINEQSSHLNENRASFLIIATEDDTQVQITPTCETWDSHSGGRTYTVSLQRGECYHVLNKNMGSTSNTEGDFSGTWIESVDEKPIAVFNGNCITSIPGGTTSGFDHVFEQAMPVDNWGKRFVVTSTNAPSYFYLLNDVVKVTALFNNTTVMKNGSTLCQLNSGESYIFDMDLNNDPCAFIESDSPIAVYLYNHSHRTTGTTTYGDPSMVWISPVEQTVYEVTFSTFQAVNVEAHYVNMVCYTSHVADLTYDGNNNFQTSFHVVPHAEEFSYARIEVSPGAHTIRCPGGFVAHVYGMGPNEGYAYTVGSSAKQLTKQLYVNNVLSTELPNGYTTCLEDATIHFRAEFNYDYDHVTWDFGDGTSGEGAEVMHDYTSAGDFDVVAVVYRLIGDEIQPSGELTVTIHVSPQIEIPVVASTCASTYHYYGHYCNVPCFEDVVFPNDEGCDTIFHLAISLGQTASAPPLYDTLCEEDEGIVWFDTLRTDPGTYIVIIPNAEDGCDSLYILNLAVDKVPEHPEREKTSCAAFDWGGVVCNETGDYRRTFTTSNGCEYDSILHFTLIPAGESTFTVDTCDYYVWLGQTYDETGSHVYTQTIVGADGCESHLTLYLTLQASAPFDRIVGLTQVAAATNFWPGEYNYFVDDSTEMDVSRVTWELLDNEGPNPWKLRPHGASCTVTAYTMGSKRLRVSSGDGECDRERFLTINSSGYGVGEEEVETLEIYPNPARDKVTLKGCAMDEVIVYNLLGQKLKTVPANGDDEVSLEVGDLPQSLYLIEVCTKKGNKTRLVSVIK